MSPVRRHFWQVVARVNSSLHFPRKWSLNWFMPAGVNSTDGSQRGTSTSLGLRTQPLDLEELQVLFAYFVGFHRFPGVDQAASAAIAMKVETTHHIGGCRERLGGWKSLDACRPPQRVYSGKAPFEVPITGLDLLLC